MKRFLSLLSGVALALAASAAFAVSAPVKIAYILPTAGCTIVNGTPIVPCDNVALTGTLALTTVDIVLSDTAISANYSGAPTLNVPAESTLVNTNFTIANGGTVHVRVRARNAGSAGAWSNEATLVVNASVQPGVPTSVTIQLNIT
jgi:hypothetical protein